MQVKWGVLGEPGVEVVVLVGAVVVDNQVQLELAGKLAVERAQEAHNDDSKPFIWTASMDAILEKVGRCKAILETAH